MMPKIVSKSHSPHGLEITPKKQKQRRPSESTGVVLAKDPSKIKLKNFHNFRVPELGKIMCTLVCKGFGVFIVA